MSKSKALGSNCFSGDRDAEMDDLLAHEIITSIVKYKIKLTDRGRVIPVAVVGRDFAVFGLDDTVECEIRNQGRKRLQRLKRDANMVLASS